MPKGYYLDVEVADQIAIAVMKDHRDMLRDEIKSHIEDGTWMHPDDLKLNKKLVKKLDFILTRYFGIEE